MSIWDWFLNSLRLDTPGWIAAFIALLALISSAIWWKRLRRWLTGIPERHRARMRRKYGGEAQPRLVKSELSVTFVAMTGNRDEYTAYMTGEILGGTLSYNIVNRGPEDVQDVQVELVGPEIESRSPTYWAELRVTSAVVLTVHIPFDKSREVVLRWRQGGQNFERRLILPTKKPPEAR